MSSAPAAARSALGRTALAVPGFVGRLTPALLAVVVTGARAFSTRAPGSLAAFGLALLLVAASLATVRVARAVGGPRAMPKWYVATVMLLAALVLVVRAWVSGWSAGCDVAMAVLLAGAPGALLVATEAPLWLAVRRGRRVGVTLRATGALRAAADARLLGLDGFSTVTDGKVVGRVDAVDESHERNLRWFAGAIAHASPTPWGRAVARLSVRGNLTEVVATEAGISGFVDRHPVRLGSLAWLGPPDGPDVHAVDDTKDAEEDVLGVEVDGRSLGRIAIVDRLRDGVPDDIAALTAAGVRPVLLAHAGPRAETIAALAGVGRMAPAEIAGTSCAVVSDDPPSFPAGPLVLGPGSDQVRLERADLASGARALRLCRVIDRAVRRSVVLAFGWHGVTIVLAIVGLFEPWMAAAAACAGMGVIWGYAAASARPIGQRS